ncbi:MAG: dockerin type I repeat-containing protein [Candidatus Glassbacteria bacterium]
MSRTGCIALTAVIVALAAGPTERAAARAQTQAQEVARVPAVPDMITNGDVNLDGYFDIFDIMQLERTASAQITPTSQELRAGDVDGNGKLTNFDLLVLNEALSRSQAGIPMFDAVKTSIEDDIGRTSDNVEIYLDLARFYRKEGLLSRAKGVLQSIMEALDPQHPLYNQVSGLFNTVSNEEIAAANSDEESLNTDVSADNTLTGKVSLRRKVVQLKGRLSQLLKDKTFSAHYNGKRVKSKLGNVMDDMLRSIGEDRMVEPEEFDKFNGQVRQVLEDPENLVKNLDTEQRDRISRLVNQSTVPMREEAIRIKQEYEDRLKTAPPVAPQANVATGPGQILNRNEQRLEKDVAQAAMQVEGRIVANPPTISPDTISLVKPTYNLHWDVSNVLGAKNASLEISKANTKFSNPRGQAPDQQGTLYYAPTLGGVSGERRGSALELEGVGIYYYRVAALNARGELISTFSDAIDLIVVYNNLITIANKPEITPGTISPGKPEYTLHWDVNNVEGAKDVAVEISKPDVEFTNPNGNDRDRASTFFFNPSLGKLSGSFTSNITGLGGPGKYQFRIIAVSPYSDFMGMWSNPATLIVTDGSHGAEQQMLKHEEPPVPESPKVESTNGNLSFSWNVTGLGSASGINYEVTLATGDTLGTGVSAGSALGQVLLSATAKGDSGSVNIDLTKLKGPGNYILRISAVDGTGKLVSSWSKPARITVQKPAAAAPAVSERRPAAVTAETPAGPPDTSAAPAGEKPPEGGKSLEVVSNNIPLYQLNNPSSPEVVTLNKGDLLIHVETNGLWYRVYYPVGGKYGWLLSFSVKNVE